MQIIVRGPLAGGEEGLRRSFLGALGEVPGLSQAFWWTTTNEMQAMLMPVRPQLLPSVVSAVREALAFGFPALRLRACAHGLVFHGIDRALTAGFLAAIDLAVGGIQSALKGPLHFPITLSCHGALGPRGAAARMSSWKVGHAECNNELLFVTDTGGFDEEALRYSIANTVMQPSSVSLVEALSLEGDSYRPAWLIRIPAAGAAAVAWWKANGLVLLVRGQRVTARAAPPIRALDSLVSTREEQDAHAARVQRDWVGRLTASIQEFFLRTSSACDEIFAEETVRRARSNPWTYAAPGRTLEGRRHVAMLAGFRVTVTVTSIQRGGLEEPEGTQSLATALIHQARGTETSDRRGVVQNPPLPTMGEGLGRLISGQATQFSCGPSPSQPWWCARPRTQDACSFPTLYG